MRIIKIEEKEYKMEYTFEAAMDEDCVSKTFKLLTSTTPTEEEALKLIGATPKSVTEIWSVGFRENHPEVTVDDAKALLKKYMVAEKKSFMAILSEIVECMGDDGFLQMIGLGEIIQATTENKKVVPTDHKKKSTKKVTPLSEN